MTDTSRNPATMTNEELHAHFSALLVSRAEDVDMRLGEFDTKLTNAMDKIDGLEKSFNAKLDVRFKELLRRLPAPAPAPTHGARRIPITGRTAGSAAAAPPAATAAADAPQTSAAATAATLGTDDGYYYDPDDDDLFDEEVEQPPQVPAGRPRHYYRNARPPVRDDDHVAKIKLNIPSFEGKYNPDAYLTWEMEVEQRFACLKYPENMRVRAATCEFTKFAFLWWSEYCRLNPTTIPSTWTALKTTMRVRFVPPTYQRDLLKNMTRLEQGENSAEEYYQELQTGMVRCGLVESTEQMLARFFGGLNKDIQHILDCKEYNAITRLFHLACKAEHEGRIAKHHGGGLKILQVAHPLGHPDNPLLLLVIWHQLLPHPRPPQDFQLLLHRHPMILLVVHLLWLPRVRQRIYNTASAGVLVILRDTAQHNV